MEQKFIAVVARAADKGERDKLLTLITPEGIRSAVIRGVKRTDAKLKSAAIPFAFCEYTAALRGGGIVITGASAIEDLFGLTAKTETLTAASIIAEAACFSFLQGSADAFVFMLKCFREILYGNQSPYLYAVEFLQYIIHESGYEYQYEKPTEEINTPLKLLAAIKYKHNLDEIPNSLILRTLKKILQNFEEKFDCSFNSKKML